MLRGTWNYGFKLKGLLQKAICNRFIIFTRGLRQKVFLIIPTPPLHSMFLVFRSFGFFFGAEQID